MAANSSSHGTQLRPKPPLLHRNGNGRRFSGRPRDRQEPGQPRQAVSEAVTRFD